ncbi:MAG: hypothetical protein AAF725_17820 [Acidobacteriota bacterium]
MTINDFVGRLSLAQSGSLVNALGQLRAEENVDTCLQVSKLGQPWFPWLQDDPRDEEESVALAVMA